MLAGPALWQRELLTRRPAARVEFWRSALAGAPPAPTLPTDLPRTPAPDAAGAHVPFIVPADLHAMVVALAARHDCTLFMVVHAALAALLSRAGAGYDVVIGAVTAGRTDGALEELVGLFVDTVVLRADTSGDPTPEELLRRVREADLDFFAHQETPFEEIVEIVGPARSTAHHPLFQVLLAFQVEPPPLPDYGGLAMRPREIATGTAKFDLTFTMTERFDRADGRPAGISGEIEYATHLFRAGTVRWLADGLVTLLRAFAERPSRPIEAVEPPAPVTSPGGESRR